MAGGAPDAQHAQWIQQAAAQNRIPAAVLAGIASVESNFGANRGPSSAGAVGYMQFLPSTARGLGINPNDDRQAIQGAARLLNQYGYQQNPTRAIAAYNAGPGNYQAGLGYAQQVVGEARRLSSQVGAGAAGAAGGVLPSSPAASYGSVSVQVPYQTFDQAGYDQARAKYIAGSAIKQAGSQFNNLPGASKGFGSSLGSDTGALFQKGLLTTGAPNAQNYVSTQTKNLTFATKQLQALAGQPLVNAHAGAAGDVNPIPGAVIGRTDMGVDANLRAGAPILAPNDAKVVAVVPNWYQGQPYVAVQLTAGPNAGKVMYVAEQIQGVPQVGTTIRKGQPITRYAGSGTGIEIGWANPSNPTQTLAQGQGNTGDASHNNAPAGVNFRSYLSQL